MDSQFCKSTVVITQGGNNLIRCHTLNMRNGEEHNTCSFQFFYFYNVRIVKKNSADNVKKLWEAITLAGN